MFYYHSTLNRCDLSAFYIFFLMFYMRFEHFNVIAVYRYLHFRSVISCARLTTSPCHLFLSSAALFSW